MSPALLILLVLLIGLGAMSYYLGFVTKETLVFRHWSQTAFVVSLLLIAFLLWGLRHQATDQSRLEAVGIVPHPAIQHSVGVPAGPGITPTWVFKTSAPRDKILDFYRQEKNRPGWNIVSDGSPVMLVLKKDSRVLTIGATEEADGCTLSYLLSK